MVHNCNPSSQEAEAGGPQEDQPWLHSNSRSVTLSLNKQIDKSEPSDGQRPSHPSCYTGVINPCSRGRSERETWPLPLTPEEKDRAFL